MMSRSFQRTNQNSLALKGMEKRKTAHIIARAREAFQTCPAVRALQFRPNQMVKRVGCPGSLSSEKSN